MKIETAIDLLKILDEARAEKGLSERELSTLIDKSPGLYWWIKRRATTISFVTVLDLLHVLDLKMTIEAK